MPARDLAKTLIPLRERISQLEATVRSLRAERAGPVSLHPPGAPLRLAHGLWRVREERGHVHDGRIAIPTINNGIMVL